MATGLFLSRSSKYCFWCWAAVNSRALSIAIAACDANSCSSLRSAAPNFRAGSRSMMATAPSSRPPTSSGTTSTAWNATWAYWRDWPDQRW